ncbi:hypothetical protein D1Z98_00235 [Riemerella anatipestifer]|nr:hypothetical protein [Riemerella anatipestifer]
MLIHKNYLYPWFGYMGYKNNEHSELEYIYTFALILLPLVLKYKKNNALIYFYSLSYMLLYIPIMVTVLYHQEIASQVYYKQFLFFISFFIIFAIPKIKRDKDYQFEDMKRAANQPMNIRGLIRWGIFSTLLLVLLYRDQISFVSFEEVYSKRSEHKAFIPLVGYMILWNVYLLGPLLIINAIKLKNRIGILVGVGMIIIVYGITAGKITLFIPMFIIFAYVLLLRNKEVFNYFCLFFSFLMLSIYAVSDRFFMLSAVILMRTFGISGLLTDQYDEFFQKNEYTYYSHINIVNMITRSYPYGDLSLGQVVSKYFDSNSNSNSNSNFWATDGIASLGDIGVIIISFLLGIFLYQWKSVMTRHNYMEMMLMLIPFSFILFNVGFFTTLLSGGFLFLLLYYYKRKYKIQKNG